MEPLLPLVVVLNQHEKNFCDFRKSLTSFTEFLHSSVSKLDYLHRKGNSRLAFAIIFCDITKELIKLTSEFEVILYSRNFVCPGAQEYFRTLEYDFFNIHSYCLKEIANWSVQDFFDASYSSHPLSDVGYRPSLL